MTMNIHEELGQLCNLLPASVGDTYKMMGIAEEEIKRMIRLHPTCTDDLNNSFKLLCPPKLIRGKSEKIYRHHARELLTRVVERKPLKNGTEAEALCFLSEASLRAPLSPESAKAMQYLFNRVMPKSGMEEVTLSQYELDCLGDTLRAAGKLR